MLGRLIEQQEGSVSAIGNMNLGNDYTSGIYNVILSQDNILETFRVIKR